MSNTSFVSKTCWINGIYVYEDVPIKDTDMMNNFGLPPFEYDGEDKGFLCSTAAKHMSSVGCKPMKKTFYLQYQYLPLVFAALAILYYAPYILFKLFNQDLKSLNEACNGRFLNLFLLLRFDSHFQYASR